MMRGIKIVREQPFDWELDEFFDDMEDTLKYDEDVSSHKAWRQAMKDIKKEYGE